MPSYVLPVFGFLFASCCVLAVLALCLWQRCRELERENAGLREVERAARSVAQVVEGILCRCDDERTN